MPDIQLRFHRDMLVLSSPVAPVLARQGFTEVGDVEYATLMEPEAVEDALRLNLVAGAQCLVTETAGMTPARLAHHGMADRMPELVKAELDAFFLNGFANPSDLKCALMGVRQVSGLPVFASVDVAADGTLADGRSTFAEALSVMAEFEASVAGFSAKAPLADACALAKQAATTPLPVLAQLDVVRYDPKQGQATEENPYYCPDVAVDAALALRAAGAQFLRATGAATPAYAGALAAAVDGTDAHRPDVEL